MGDVIPFPACERFPAVPETIQEISAEDRAQLKRLRHWFVRMLLCNPVHLRPELASEEDNNSPHILGQRLCNYVHIHGRKRFVVYPDKQSKMSKDEAWFLSLIKKAQQNDEASVRALIAWAVQPSGQREAYLTAMTLGKLLNAA